MVVAGPFEAPFMVRHHTELRGPVCVQVIVDVPRTAPGVPFFAQKQLQKSLERILYLWGIR